ncbi:MAG: hypothetical protein AB7Q97_22555 [Gammaproteobacteria bacterium]
MALTEKKGRSYGENHADLQEEIRDYSKRNGYPAERFADARCENCGATTFSILLDDAAGCAQRTCVTCKNEHFIGDSKQYADEAELGECACPCGTETFEASAGVHLYEGSADVKWFYLGLRCTACGLVAVYGDWKNEFEGYEGLLAQV